MQRTILAAIASLVLSACGGASKAPASITSTSAPAATPTLAPDDAPMPEHLTFAPGETIAADGKAGVFFLDPRTGAAEAWVVPAGRVAGQPDIGYLPFTFTVGGVSADGSRLVYTCQEHNASGQLAPCAGASHDVWYLLDTKTGARTRLAAFDGSFATISPDGETLLGLTGQALALASADRPGALRKVELTGATSPALFADWSPDSTRVVVRTGIAGYPTQQTYLLSVGDGTVSDLPAGASVAWSRDGARFAVGRSTESSAAVSVRERSGSAVWSKPLLSLAGGPELSADGKLLYVFERDADPSAGDPNPPDRGEVLDAATGATLLRVKGTFCPEGWVGATRRFVVGTYGAGEIVVDVDAATYVRLPGYAHPAPFDDTTVYAFDGNDFHAIDIATGASRLIAHTTVFPAWDPAHPLFAGDRIFFTPLHGGHGGCGEGSGPTVIPKIEIQHGPFRDDAPVTRGG